MNEKPFSRRIRTAALFLTVLAVILTAANFILRKYVFSAKAEPVVENTTPEGKIEILDSGIDSLFFREIRSFGINETYIKKLEPKNVPAEEVVHSYQIKVPADLPIPVLLQQLTSSYAPYNLLLTAVETKLHGNTTLKIDKAGKYKFIADFIVDKTLNRDAGRIAFILDASTGITPEEFEELSVLPEALTFLLSPSKETKKAGADLEKKGKTYFLLFHDNIEEDDYSLDPTFTKKRLQSGIGTIVSSFPGTRFFFIDDKSQLANAVEFAFIKEEFEKRSIRLIPLSEYTRVSAGDAKDAAERFTVFAKELKKGDAKVIIFPAAYYRAIQEEVTLLRKRGVKIESARELIK